mgnify:CR=1 FL=1|tara:strand:- start:2501 stop:2677 length:177 start_codon:yes stop_codon:yes gene_type:complete
MKFGIFYELQLPKPWQADNHQCWKQSVLSGETLLEDLDTGQYKVESLQTRVSKQPSAG